MCYVCAHTLYLYSMRMLLCRNTCMSHVTSTPCEGCEVRVVASTQAWKGLMTLTWVLMVT